MFWGISTVISAVVDAFSAVVNAIESLLVRLLNPSAHAWIGMNGRAVELHDRHMLDEAAPLYEEALRLGRKSRRPRRVAITLVNMALLELEQRRLEEARDHLAEALGIRNRELGQDSPATVSTRRWLASVYVELGQPAKAAELLAFGRQRAAERFGEESSEFAVATLALAAAHEKAGDLDTADELYRTTAAMVERVAGPRAKVTAHYLLQLGEFLVRRDRMADAALVLARAAEIWDMVGDQEALIPAADLLVTVYRATGDREAAVAMAGRLARNVARFQNGDRAAVAAALERQVDVLRWAGQTDEADKLARRAAILRKAVESEQARDEYARESARPLLGSVVDVLSEAKPQKG